jgi:hypothetical protein
MASYVGLIKGKRGCGMRHLVFLGFLHPVIGLLLVFPFLAVAVDSGSALPNQVEPRASASAVKSQVAERAAQERLVAERCAAQTDPEKAIQARNWVEESIRTDRDVRGLITSLLSDRTQETKSVVCREVVNAQLEQLASIGPDEDADKRKTKLNAIRPFLFTALSAGMPRAIDLMAEHLARDPSGEWLIALRSMDADVYSRTVQDVARKLAARLRTEFELPLQDASLYGRTRQNVFVEKTVRFKNPLVIHSFVSEWIDRGQSPSLDDWSVMNILYATMVQQDRTMVSQLLTSLIRSNDRQWIESLRREPVWVQYRLLNLARDAGGAEVVRELMWITEAHADEHMRLLAASSLDALVSRAGQSEMVSRDVPQTAPEGK